MKNQLFAAKIDSIVTIFAGEEVKMTNNEIIKALMCCGDKNCKYCPNFSEDIECSEKLIKLSLDLINRQKAEIERLKQTPKCVYAYDGKTVEYCVEGPCSVEKTIDEIKSEAIREFAEKLKEKQRRVLDYDEAGYSCPIFVVEVESINNFVKELTEQ